MTEFKLALESVQGGISGINLFDKVVKDQKEKSTETDGFEVVEPYTEYLMYLDAEQPVKEKENNKKAEIIVVVDKSGSMQGTPWRQVQSALVKMLDITRDVNNCQVIAYNQSAEKFKLSGSRSKDKFQIESIRAGGSTNFVAVFQELENAFKEEKGGFSLFKTEGKMKDSSVPHYIFLMTDGQDTCNSPREIIAAKEHLQAEIERFGGEVIFNVLGFSDDHNEDFLESLALIGTSDGSYSFVSPNEGEKALEERLVALVKSTSSNIGRMVNIEANGENIDFLGDWFGESEKEVILPAKMSRKGDKVTISTRKFVRIRNGEEPKMTLRIHEKLRGDTKPMEATIKAFEKIELKDKQEIDVHNLKKLRSAMNLVSGHLADTEKAEDDAVAKAGYELVKNKINNMNDLDVKNPDIKRLQDNVKGFVKQCEFVFHPGVVSDKERGMRSKGMRSVQAMPCSGQSQNMMRQMKKPSAMRYKTTGRSELQSKVRQTDYSRHSDSDSD
jgi:uncharacterized protein YegL